jgi:predicted secreted protein
MPSPTKAFKAQGTLLQVGNLATASTTYVTVSELRTLNYTNRADELDASNHDTVGSYREFVAGFKDFQINIGGNFLPNDTTQDGTTGLQYLYHNNLTRDMRFRWPQPTPKVQMMFSGIVTEYSVTSDAGALASFTGRVRAQGAPVFSTWS